MFILGHNKRILLICDLLCPLVQRELHRHRVAEVPFFVEQSGLHLKKIQAKSAGLELTGGGSVIITSLTGYLEL